jgi:hypothetical protein
MKSGGFKRNDRRNACVCLVMYWHDGFQTSRWVNVTNDKIDLCTERPANKPNDAVIFIFDRVE